MLLQGAEGQWKEDGRNPPITYQAVPIFCVWGFLLLKNAVTFDTIDRIWIFRCFQPSVHSKTASSSLFYRWVWKMTFWIFENPGILSTPRWRYIYIYIYTHKSTYVYLYPYLFLYLYHYLYSYMYVYRYISISSHRGSSSTSTSLGRSPAPICRPSSSGKR